MPIGSYIEHATEVTLHKLVDGAWQTEPETVRIDVMHDSSQSMFYVVAQASLLVVLATLH